MLYLSQLINKPIGYEDKQIGKVVDMAVSGSVQVPVISKLLIKKNDQKIAMPAKSATFESKHWQLKTKEVEHLPRNEENDFYLVEDLLDKQVIDINGRRLVRVNDVILKANGELKAEGIDIGLTGIFRRLGLNFLNMNLKNITLPWSLIEAFDYQTGSVQLKLTQNRLNNFHPAELADILEEAGTKERLGLVRALNDKKAAYAISEADEETQSAILEQVSTNRLKNIVEKMHSSKIADVIDKLNPFTSSQILSSLESDKAKKVKKLLIFEDDEAGGLMDFSFYKEKGSKTIGATLDFLSENEIRPEAVVIIDEEGRITGTIPTKNLLNVNRDTRLTDLVKFKIYVHEDAPFSQILRLFAEYNLRLLPVVDQDKKVIGAISIDSLLAKIQEEEEKEDAI